MMPFFTILRPLNLLQASLAVLLTVALLDQMDQANTLILLILSVITINGAGNIINDIFDVEIDRVNRPDRPLPSGKMSLSSARNYMIILFMIGIILARVVSTQTFVIAGIIATPILILYSARLKRMVLIGNITVSFMLGLAFIYVGSAFNSVEITLPMAALAFGFTLIREIVKDLEDLEGDRLSGAETLPLKWGELKTRNFVLLLMALFCFLDLLPVYLEIYNHIYFWVVLLGINLPILISAIILWQFPEKKNYSRIQLFLKLNIFVGLAAIYLGRPV